MKKHNRLIYLCGILLLPMYSIAQLPFVEFMEYEETGRYGTLESGFTRYEVDINSFIDVEPKPENFSSPVYSSNGESISSDKLQYITTFINDFNTRFTKVSNELELLTQTSKNNNPTSITAIKNKLNQFSELILELDDIVTALYSESYAEQLYDNAAKMSDPNALHQLQIEAVLQFVEKEKTILNSRLEKNKIQLRMWCFHESQGKSSVPIHLENYDTLSSGSLKYINKTAFTRTAEEEKEISRQLETINAIVNAFNQTKDLISDITKSANSIKERVKNDLKEVDNWLSGIEKDFLSNLDELILELQKVGDAETIRLINELKKIDNSLQSIIKLKNIHSKIIGELPTTDTNDPRILFDLIDSQISTTLKDLENLKSTTNEVFSEAQLQSLNTIFINIKTIIETNINNYSTDLKEQLTSLKNSQIDDWLKTVDEIKGIFVKYEDLINLLKSLKNNVDQVESVVSTINRNPIASYALTLPFSNPPSTTIEIPRTERKENDLYVLHLEISQGNTILETKSYSFRIKTYGIYREWTAGLNFVQHKGEKAFIPSTSVSYILHYRSTSKFKNNKWKGGKNLLGNFINMGFGLNSVILPSIEDNTNIQFGLGASITLFNDLLQVGGGLNLQRKKNDTYFFITASLLELVNRRNFEK